jgi:hypothetical protein
VTTRYRKMQAELRAKYARWEGKFPHKCKACGKLFFAYRPDAQTCSQRCRKAYSRSPAGALARLKRLGASHDQADRKQAAQTRTFNRAWRQIVEDSKSGLKLKRAAARVVQETPRIILALPVNKHL